MAKNKTIIEECDVLLLVEEWLVQVLHLKQDTGEEI